MGHASLTIGFVGIFVPLLPTTPFVLLAALCYSRGSERFHTWLHRHPRFGPMIHAWREHRAIGPRAKLAGAVMVLLSMSYSMWRLDLPWSVIPFAVGVAVLSFILFRPTSPSAQQSPPQQKARK
jgi:uncharacterized membrane protein YbaN (DUF454 family)